MPSLISSIKVDLPHLTQHSQFLFAESRCGVNTQRNHIAFYPENIFNFTQIPRKEGIKCGAEGRRKEQSHNYYNYRGKIKNYFTYPAKKTAVLRVKLVRFYLILNLAKARREG